MYWIQYRQTNNSPPPRDHQLSTVQCWCSSCPTGKHYRNHCHWPHTHSLVHRNSPPSLYNRNIHVIITTPMYTLKTNICMWAENPLRGCIIIIIILFLIICSCHSYFTSICIIKWTFLPLMQTLMEKYWTYKILIFHK